jgi:hypothetical protein
MQGSLKDMDLAELIQYICIDLKTVRVSIEGSTQKAVFYFDKGVPAHAESGQLEGEEVVYEALTWKVGTFTLESDIKPPKKTIERSWKYLMLEGARRLDERENTPIDELLTKSISEPTKQKETYKMATINETLAEIMKMNGAMAAAIVDWKSGMTLGTAGSGVNVDLAAAGNTNVVRAKLSVMRDLKLKGFIEDMLITLTDQYHLIRMLDSNHDLFVYVVLSRDQANLGLARHKLAELEHDLTV